MEIGFLLVSNQTCIGITRKHYFSDTGQGVKLLALRLSGTPKNTVGKPFSWQGFPIGKIKALESPFYARLSEFFRKARKSCGKPIFRGGFPKGKPIILRNFAPCRFIGYDRRWYDFDNRLDLTSIYLNYCMTQVGHGVDSHRCIEGTLVTGEPVKFIANR